MRGAGNSASFTGTTRSRKRSNCCCSSAGSFTAACSMSTNVLIRSIMPEPAGFGKHRLIPPSLRSSAAAAAGSPCRNTLSARGGPEWERIQATAEECPRIRREFLEEERATMGDRWFRQEYLCQFEDSVSTVFDRALIEQAITYDVEPLAYR